MLDALRDAVLSGDAARTGGLVRQALESELAPEQILRDALLPAMDVVGEEFETGIRFIPEMLISAEAMRMAMIELRPLLVQAGVQPVGKVLLGTVEGDLHDIGKDLVGMMLEGAAFEVIDLGIEVTAERFVAAVREHKPNILAMSALLTTTMIHMPEVIDALQQAELRESVRVIIGGAPVTQEYSDKIGADGYATDAASAVKVAKQLLGSTTDSSGRA